jgi:hypothetical protein
MDDASADFSSSPSGCLSNLSPNALAPFSKTTVAFFERMETITAHRDQFLLSASGEIQKQLDAHQPAIQYSKRGPKHPESPSRLDGSDHESNSCRSPELGPRLSFTLPPTDASNRLEDLYEQLFAKLQYMQVCSRRFN